jgi:hypothetical protein
MICHECARRSIEAPGVGLCRYCLVSLCKDHLVESLRSRVVPQYTCDHRPECAFESADSRGISIPLDRPAGLMLRGPLRQPGSA